MELKEAIYNRRSVRSFLDRPVEREKIEQIVDAGQWAPSACNKQGWRFVVVEDKEFKQRIFETAGSSRLIASAPVAIFVFYGKHLTEHKFAYIQSASAAIQNMLLTAHSLGLGAVWLGSLGDSRKIEKMLGAADDFELIAAVALGYPKETPLAPKRQALKDILSFGRFNFGNSGYPFTYDPTEWALEQIIRFREDSLRAAGPSENRFTFGRAKENEQEINFAAQGAGSTERILEIMPFAGSHTLRMLRAGLFNNYYLFELSRQPLDFIRSKLSYEQVSTSIIAKTGRLDALPFGDDFFERVVVFQKLEMLPDLKIIDEIYRVLKPGGRLIVSFKNKCGLYGIYYWYKFKRSREPIWNYGPFAPLHCFEIKKLLKSKGFTIEKEKGISPLVFIGKTIGRPFTFLGRLVILQAKK